MAGILKSVKTAALNTYVSACCPTARRLRASDAQGTPRTRPRDHRSHIRSAAHWLCRAQNVGNDAGVSALYSFAEGWVGSYPETTGYIIPTMIHAAEYLHDGTLRDRAAGMAEWLLTRQRSDGAFPGSFDATGLGDRPPRVFNSGQIVFGLLAAAKRFEEPRFLEAAVGAGRWLSSVQDDDGAWRRFTFHDTAHAYNVRTAWALARLADATGDATLRRAAIANAEWTLHQETDAGWFRHNGFHPRDGIATLHTIAYTMQGLLELGVATGETAFVDAGRRAVDSILNVFEGLNRVPGAYADGWRTPAAWRCLPGEAQLAVSCLRLAGIDGRSAYATTAARIMEATKRAQVFDPSLPDVHGGITGSLPVDAPYERYCLLSWGAKFFIDALLMLEDRERYVPTG